MNKNERTRVFRQLEEHRPSNVWPTYITLREFPVEKIPSTSCKRVRRSAFKRFKCRKHNWLAKPEIFTHTQKD